MNTKSVSKAITVLDKIANPKKIDEVQVTALRKESTKIYAMAESMVVENIQSKVFAENFSRDCNEFKKRVKSFFAPELERRTEEKRRATAEKKEIDDLIEAFTVLIDEAQRTTDRKCRDWIAAENRRIEDENRKKLLAAQKKTEEEKKAKIDELKDIGTPEARRAAKELKAAPAVADLAELERTVSSGEGIVHREAWTCMCAPPREDVPWDEALSLDLLVAAAYKEPEKYMRFLTLNWTALNAEARAMKNKFYVPGFCAVDQGSTAHRG